VFEGGPGAWEAVLHLSFLDLDSGNFKGGKMWRLTPMVNWHLSDNIRWEFIYGYAELDRFDFDGHTQFLQSRLQLTL
jgi:phosphate-selective porin OprO/OprP